MRNWNYHAITAAEAAALENEHASVWTLQWVKGLPKDEAAIVVVAVPAGTSGPAEGSMLVAGVLVGDEKDPFPPPPPPPPKMTELAQAIASQGAVARDFQD